MPNIGDIFHVIPASYFGLIFSWFPSLLVARLFRVAQPQLARTFHQIRPEKLHVSAFIAYGNHVEVIAVLSWLWILRWGRQPLRVGHRSIPLQIFRPF